MNKYDDRYNIAIACRDDIDDIMNFIGNCWRKDHIMSLDRELFEYEFVDGDTVNFILARDNETNNIEAIFGFIYCSNPRGNLPKDLWGSFWKVYEEERNMPFLGIELAKRVYDLTGCRMHIGNGADPTTTIPLRKLFFKEKTGKMKQYYLLNNEKEEYVVAQIVNKKIGKCIQSVKLRDVIELKDFEAVRGFIDIDTIDAIPRKDNWYVEKRYFKHPYFKYMVWGFVSDSGNKSIVIAREIDVNGVKILRIVDYIGNHQAFAESGGFWQELLAKNNYEYIDFVEHGMDDNYILDAGFILREENDVNVIPNYFEPFVQKNADIWFHCKNDATTFFKGDCDQDRPNIYRREK